MTKLFFILLLSLFSTVTSEAFTRGVPSTTSSLFGVRGGGLFGKGDAAKDKSTKDVATSEASTKYPAMTQQEIEEWMDHIPVYAVTDSKGAGVVVRPADGNDTNVFYFFINPQGANATLQQLRESNSELDLKVSAFSLGKIWFKLLHPEEKHEVKIKFNDGDGETTSAGGIEYRLVPDTKDLLGARMLLTMTPEDSEKLKNGEMMSSEMAQKALERAIADSPKFKASYNEIPVFAIAQMRMMRSGESQDSSMLPLYLSLQNMIATWQGFVAKSNSDLSSVEPAINLMGLSDLVELMSKESEINFRQVLLVPPTQEGAKGSSSSSSPSAMQPSVTTPDPMAGMGGATLGDL
eukprot:Nitzschia sp. Nitz4//scaffold11_size288233//38472//39700//NITZ4_000737-RA/size288233-snap-gene-0.7-mRNA-1//1//CDS//3329533963//7615//frame0